VVSTVTPVLAKPGAERAPRSKEPVSAPKPPERVPPPVGAFPPRSPFPTGVPRPRLLLLQVCAPGKAPQSFPRNRFLLVPQRRRSVSTLAPSSVKSSRALFHRDRVPDLARLRRQVTVSGWIFSLASEAAGPPTREHREGLSSPGQAIGNIPRRANKQDAETEHRLQ
jgi:hypothetical protein